MFGHLEHSVRTGSPAIEAIESGACGRTSRVGPRSPRFFGQAMTAKAAADIGSVLGSWLGPWFLGSFSRRSVPEADGAVSDARRPETRIPNHQLSPVNYGGVPREKDIPERAWMSLKSRMHPNC